MSGEGGVLPNKRYTVAGAELDDRSSHFAVCVYVCGRLVRGLWVDVEYGERDGGTSDL